MAQVRKKSEKVSMDALVSKEIKRLEGLLQNLPADKLKANQSLIENAAFMTVQLKELQIVMNKNGVISEYQNGANQWGTKKSPEVEIYNTMIKNLVVVMKSINDLLPDGEASKSDALLDFLKGSK